MNRLERRTGETRVRVGIGLPEDPASAQGSAAVETGDGFLDHMLETLARYAGLDVEVAAEGDLHHHLVEDVAITLGRCLQEAAPPRAARYGWAQVPMDEALVEAALDLGGRAHYEGELPSDLYEHFLRSFSMNLEATLHTRVLRGRDRHHVVEGAVKAVGLALRQALQEGGGVFSTKGSVEWARPGELDADGGLDRGEAG